MINKHKHGWHPYRDIGQTLLAIRPCDHCYFKKSVPALDAASCLQIIEAKFYETRKRFYDERLFGRYSGFKRSLVVAGQRN